MDARRFDRIWGKFRDSKYDVGFTRRKTAWNILRFYEAVMKEKSLLHKRKER